MKKFKVVKSYIVDEWYEVEAHTKEEALNKFMNGDENEFDLLDEKKRDFDFQVD